MKRPRYGRPNRASLFGTMLLNALAGSVVLYLACTLFGVNAIVIGQFAAHGITVSERWGVVLPMLPGIGIGMGCLWFWLVLGRAAQRRTVGRGGCVRRHSCRVQRAACRARAGRSGGPRVRRDCC